jgi:RNA polymerase sigma factor (sigma-70 family)
MNEQDWLAGQFEENRRHLRAVAYRMLGSLSEADDAVQEAWIRLSRSEAGSIGNLGGWLTTVVGRVCLDMLRSRKSRREESLEAHVPDPVLSRDDQNDPERDAVIADGVGLALLVVLETLDPPERLAFVLHDMFATPFDEIAAMLGCSVAAARQHASRARRRVRGAAPGPDRDLSQQRRVVDAFVAAVRAGNFEALLKVLDPDVVRRSDRLPEARGAHAVAESAILFSKATQSVQPVLVNGSAGLIAWLPSGQPFSILAFTIRRGLITEIDVYNDPERLRRLDLKGLRER